MLLSLLQNLLMAFLMDTEVFHDITDKYKVDMRGDLCISFARIFFE